ncbi:MAG TPA: histidine kinase [Geodermatophilus sp.]|nr:histidine kinase [Geodermatophilus sp.]
MSVATSVARFTVAGVVVTLTLAAVIAVLARRAGIEDATRSAEQVARVVAHAVVAPMLTPELFTGDSEARADLRAAVDAVADSGPVDRVTIWDADGRVLWSDERRLVGQVFTLRPDARRALEQGTVISAIADLDGREHEFERPATEILEVYVGVRDGNGRPLLVEIHQGYEVVEQAAMVAWMRFAPASLGALLVLQLLQVPFAWRLARRLRRHQEAEAFLLQSAVDASEAERRRIAAEVHDGVVQDLTGLTYDLDAARRRATSPESAALIARTSERVRQGVTQLRGLLVDLNPPRLPQAGLGPAIEVLAEGLERSGIRVELDAREAEGLPEHVATLLYRCALEALRNVSAHSDADHVQITVRRTRDDAVIVIDDDGRGFDRVRLATSDVHGHLGLRALGDRVAAVGGSLSASSAPGQGTRVVAQVPLEVQWHPPVEAPRPAARDLLSSGNRGSA